MNRNDLQVENYLANLRQKGTLDSEGTFTVAGCRAVGKLALFLLAKESDWILKIVQAACVAGCSDLRVKQTRISTQISLVLPYPLDFTAFERGLTSPTPITDAPGIEELYCGLRAVGVGQLRDWVLRAQAGGQVTILSCSDGLVSAERLESDEPASRDRTDLILGVAYPRGQRGKIGGLVRFGEAVQNEHLALLTRGRACPIPLFLDGRRLDDLNVPGLVSALETRAFLGINLPPSDGSLSIRVPNGLSPSPQFQFQDRFCESKPYCLSAIPESRTARSLQRWYFNYTTSRETFNSGSSSFYFQDVPSPSRICLLRHGVVVAEKNIGIVHPISAEIFLPADHLRSDLTGLQVRPTDEEIDLAKREVRGSLPFLERLFAQLEEYSPRPKKHQLLMYGGLGALGLLVPTLALKAIAGTFSTVMIARAAHHHQQIVKDCLRHLESFRQGIEASEPR